MSSLASSGRYHYYFPDGVGRSYPPVVNEIRKSRCASSPVDRSVKIPSLSIPNYSQVVTAKKKSQCNGQCS